ncbi:hypothetical protein F8S13_14135 [Chloroflexia bacterium SDU3-3]|nr:hypothetical protein F8S13_14135 [Chloroflexia bacterium SDU3-3]
MRFSLYRLCCLLALCALLGSCAAAPEENTHTFGGGVNPEGVTENFFEDFDKTLKDPDIQNKEVRSRWVAILSDYFAPAEREDQRIALSTMLATYARQMQEEVGPGEEFKIEIRYGAFRQLSNTGDYALVQVEKGSIYWQVLRNGYLIDEQETPLSRIIGRDDNTVPTIRVGDNWFLTENYEPPS